MGATQFISIESKHVIAWLTWWLNDRRPNEFVFPRYAKAGECFKAVMAELGLEHVHYTLGSLRTGGATAHFRQYRNLPRLQYLGRWSNPGSLAYYLQETMSEHLTTIIDASVRSRLASMAALFPLLAQPPPAAPPRRR